MALKDWDDIPYADSDCLSNAATYNDMIEYIKHSASCDFTIYDDEDSSNQKFKFTVTGAISNIYGGNSTGNDLKLWSNSFDAYPFITLNGASDIFIDTYANVIFKEQGTQMFKFSLDGNDSIITATDDMRLVLGSGDDFYICDNATRILKVYEKWAGTTEIDGGASSGNDLILKANSHNDFPFISLDGGGAIDLHHADGWGIYLHEGSTYYGSIHYNADNEFEIGSNNKNITLDPGTGFVKFNQMAIVSRENAGGVLYLDETTAAPTPIANYGAIYTKADNKLYCQTGDGVEHEIAFV